MTTTQSIVPNLLLRMILIAGLVLMLTLAARGQATGDAARGRAFATRVCAECHAVRRGEETSPDPRTVPFARIANTPGMTDMALMVWLRTPHDKMPNLVLNVAEINDVVAYIATLRDRQSRLGQTD